MAGIKNWFYAIDVMSGWFPITIWALVAIGIIVLLICQSRGESRKRFLKQLGIGLLAGFIGLAVTYVCSDVFLLFGVSLGWPVIIAIGVGVFLLAFMVAAAVMTHGWLRVLAIVMIPVTLLATAVRVNEIYGEYQTMGSLFDYSPYPHISALNLSLSTISVREWNEQAVAKSRNTTQIPQSGKLVRGHPESEIRVQGARGARVAATGGLCQAPAEIAGHGDVRRPARLAHQILHRQQHGEGPEYIRRRAPWTRADCGQPGPEHRGDAQQPVCGHHEMGQGRNVSCTGCT